MKVTIIPVVIGVLGTIPNSLVKGLEDLEIGGKVQHQQHGEVGLNTERTPNYIYLNILPDIQGPHNLVRSRAYYSCSRY